MVGFVLVLKNICIWIFWCPFFHPALIMTERGGAKDTFGKDLQGSQGQAIVLPQRPKSCDQDCSLSGSVAWQHHKNWEYAILHD